MDRKEGYGNVGERNHSLDLDMRVHCREFCMGEVKMKEDKREEKKERLKKDKRLYLMGLIFMIIFYAISDIVYYKLSLKSNMDLISFTIFLLIYTVISFIAICIRAKQDKEVKT